MNFFLRLAAYLFHPLLMPLLGTAIYYAITPRFNEIELVKASLFAVIILTVFIPLVIFFILKNLGLAGSIHLENLKERKYPLMIHCLLLLLILKMVFDPFESPELYYFFVGILFSAISALILLFFKFKVSLHQMGVAGITMFVIGLSAHFKVNLLLTISFFLFVNGWVASSRLHTESHSFKELMIGLFLGIIPQLMVFNFWL